MDYRLIKISLTAFINLVLEEAVGMRLVEANHWLISSRLDQPLWHLRNTYISYIVNVTTFQSICLSFINRDYQAFWTIFTKTSNIWKNLRNPTFFGETIASLPFVATVASPTIEKSGLIYSTARPLEPFSRQKRWWWNIEKPILPTFLNKKNRWVIQMALEEIGSIGLNIGRQSILKVGHKNHF